MQTEKVSTLKIHKLTQAQYDREAAAGNIDEYALYLTPDEEPDLSTKMDKANPTGTGAVSINRKADTTIGEYSVAMGNDNSAEGIGSFAMGSTSTCGPDAEYSAALGETITITGANSFSTGYGNTVSGSWSAVFGESNDMSVDYGLAAGYGNTVRGRGGCAIGAENIVNYTCGVTLGNGCTAHYFALAQGLNTTATGNRSAAFNDGTTASGNNSAAFNNGTTASGNNSAAFGAATTALDGQLACGAANDTSSATAGNSWGGTGSGTAFVVGNGTTTYTSDGALLTEVGSNAFRVDYNGAAYGKSAYTTTGCDYAEYFEWKDSNPENEDRRGYFVTLDGEKIKIAEPGDYILGIISGHPAVIGNGDESWMGRYILDDFGDFIYEDFEYEVQEPEDVVNEETGEVTIQTKTVKKTGKKYKENPDYDPSVIYIQRADRPEWDAVGMIGVLSVRDDGTCQVNGYCKVAAGGTATAAESGYRVVKRVNDNIVKVIFK